MPTEQDRATVQLLAGFLIPVPQIALAIRNPRSDGPLNEKSLRRHFKKELQTGAVRVQLGIMANLYQIASTRKDMAGVTAGLRILTGRFGWADKRIIELTGADGKPLQTESVHKFSEEDLERMPFDQLSAIFTEAIQTPIGVRPRRKPTAH